MFFNARDAKEAIDSKDTFFRQDLPDSIAARTVSLIRLTHPLL
jgi:hypothetical protein